MVTLACQRIKKLEIELFQAITCTFMHGFQNNMAQMFSLKSRSATEIFFSSTLKVKVK